MIRQTFTTPETLAQGAAQAFAQLALETVRSRGAFHVALSGGSTPKLLYRALRELSVPWPQVWVYFSDERCVPPDSPDSNYRLAHDELLSRVAVPATQVLRLAGELEPQEAARDYADRLPEQLDLVLLGMGEDGHTASLFPGTEGLTASGRVVANRVAQLDTWRLSLTFDEINSARERWLLVTGAGKAGVLREVQQRSGLYPVERLVNARWFLDEAAARELSP